MEKFIESKAHIIIPSHCKATNQLVPKGLTLSNGTKTSCGHFFCVKLKKEKMFRIKQSSYELNALWANQPMGTIFISNDNITFCTYSLKSNENAAQHFTRVMKGEDPLTLETIMAGWLQMQWHLTVSQVWWSLFPSKDTAPYFHEFFLTTLDMKNCEKLAKVVNYFLSIR